MPDEPRVIVVGTSSCGKTTFARRLASALGVPRIELDELYWGPGWQPKPQSEFMRLVAEASDAGAWVAEGNYSAAREVLWPRATTIIWLNFSLAEGSVARFASHGFPCVHAGSVVARQSRVPTPHIPFRRFDPPLDRHDSWSSYPRPPGASSFESVPEHAVAGISPSFAS